MSLSREIEISDFSGGLITDLDDAELPKAAASRLVNGDVRNKKLETLPGLAAVDSGLPAGLTVLARDQFVFTQPSEQTCTLVYGTLSGAHKLYIKPYISSAGAWVDAWQDLTEYEGPYTADATTSGTQIVDSQLLSTTTDYYKGWVVWNSTRQASAIVTAYNGSTKTLSLSWTIQDAAAVAQQSGDSYQLFRNNIFSTIDQEGATGLDTLFKPTRVSFLARDNAVAIVTGNTYGYGVITGTDDGATDLLLTVINNRAAFDDTDLTYTGFYLTRKHPAGIISGGMGTLGRIVNCTATAVASATETMTAGDYIVFVVPRYDGYQDAAIDPGITSYDGTLYYPITSTPYNVVTIGANEKIQVAVSVNYSEYSNGRDVQLFRLRDPASSGVYQDFLTFDRRITSLLFYVSTINGLGQLTSEIRYVKSLAVNSAAWSGSGPNYTQTITITKPEYDAGEGIDISDRQGHASLRIDVNANFIATAKRRVAVANVFADQQRQSFVFFSAINSDEQNMPDVIPHTSFIDLSLYGIPKIIGFLEALGFYVAIGENQVVKIDAATLSVDKNIQTRGGSSSNAFVNANGLLYFVNLEDIYYYHPSQDVVRSIATGFVREAWRALSTSSKQAAAIGYDRRFEKLVIAAGTTIYTYNLPAAFADPLSSDTQAIGSWAVYDVSKTFLRFYTDVLGRCIGIASDGIAYEVFSSGVANTMVYEKVLGESLIAVDALRMTYNATATVTVELYDMARTSSYPIQTYKFPAQSLHMQYNHYKGCKLYRPKIKISAPVGTTISQLSLNPQNIDNN